MSGDIVAMGGGGFSMEPENPLLDDFLLSLARRQPARVCFLPTASGDSAPYVARFYRAFAKRCIPTDLTVFDSALPRRPPNTSELAAFLAEQDVIYVGGGNTANLLAVWRVHGLDVLLRNALNNGTVLAGLSAGMICWFEGGVTDSFGGLQALNDGLGFLSGTACPHYDGESERRPAYHRLINAGFPAGYAVDDGAALHFRNARLVEAVSSRRDAGAYRVTRADGRIEERRLPYAFSAPVRNDGVRRLPAVVMMVALVAAGCGQQALLGRLASPEDQTAARRYLDLLQHRQYEPIEKAVDPSMAGPSVHPALVRMADALPAGEPEALKLLGANTLRTSASASTVSLTYEYRIAGQWILANVTLRKRDGVTTVAGIHVDPRRTSVEEENRFTLTGKTPGQYLMLSLAVLVPLFILMTLIICLRTRWRGRRWPWIIFIICGLGRLSMNWISGQTALQLLSVQLFGAGMLSTPYGAPIVSVSLPVGAIIFLLRRKALMKAD